jgi:predicted metal-binding membrane protein
VNGLEAVLRRERAVAAIAIVVLAALAWAYLWRGAGMGMSALEMTAITLFPHLASDPLAGMPMRPAGWLTVVAMWWTMMIAMMTPSAAPIVLLYGRVLRQQAPRQQAAQPQPTFAPPIILVAGYLAAWLAFSIAAASLQFALVRWGLITSMTLRSGSRALSAAVLLGAGIYQLAPMKRTCLRHCRGPVDFLVRHWRPGRLGAFVMGVRHGTWCVGCCWMLMALLFVGGVMNLAWITLLTLLIAAEKLAPAGAWVSRLAGVALIVWSAATLLV